MYLEVRGCAWMYPDVRTYRPYGTSGRKELGQHEAQEEQEVDQVVRGLEG